jgi:GH3 auxin-responsive promoter
MPSLLKSTIRLRGQIASLALDRAASEPAHAQREVLGKILSRNADTVFGREHGFASINGEADYRRRVPVNEYESLRPYVDRIVAGEKAVLTKSAPFMLTMTSGTTGEPKYIPVTRESQEHNSGLMRQWLYRALLHHPEFLDQASVGIVSRAVEGYTPSGIPYGSASGLIYKNIPWLIRRAYAVPYLISELHDYDQRYFLSARFALAARVSFIATPNPSTLNRLAALSIEHQERLIRAIHDGTIGIDAHDQKEVYARLAARLKPDPARARTLAQVVKEKSFLLLADCWPDLKLIGCWTGGSVRFHARKLHAHFTDTPVRDLGYLASEGRITVPYEDQTPSGILALRSGYYEFIPEDEADSAHPCLLSSHELEEGGRYSILLTTTNGLYRYKINDIVEVTGHYRRAPLLAFVRKGGEMANITGEKMHVNHLIQAMDEVRRRFNLDIEQYRAIPDFARSRYEIYLELKREAPLEMLRDEVLPELDRQLARANVEYDQKRQSKRLDAPCLHLMAQGWADAALRRHVAAGKRDTQYKWRILCAEQSPENLKAIVSTIEVGSSLPSIAGT